MTIMYKNEATMAIPIALFKHKFTQVSILSVSDMYTTKCYIIYGLPS